MARLTRLVDYVLENSNAETLTLTQLEGALYERGGKVCISTAKPFPDEAKRFGRVWEHKLMTNPPKTFGYDLEIDDTVKVKEIVYG